MDNAARLAKNCVESINAYEAIGGDGRKATVTITTPQGWKKPVPFPRLTLYQVNPRGHRVYGVNAFKMLAWLVAQGLVRLETSP